MSVVLGQPRYRCAVPATWTADSSPPVHLEPAHRYQGRCLPEGAGLFVGVLSIGLPLPCGQRFSIAFSYKLQVFGVDVPFYRSPHYCLPDLE